MRILVIEDEPRVLHNLARALREEGYAVDTAGAGNEGLYKAKNYPYDAVVLDVMLPEIDGWELLRRLRLEKRTPVLMLTAKDTTADQIKGFDHGADDYLTKPYDLKILLVRLRALIRRAAGHATPEIVLGDVTINLGARSVTRSGDRVALTATEYAIIEMLALHRGKVVSRTMLYEHIFDETDDTLSNLVDVHIFSVRKKLGSGLIETRRGQGYLVRE